MPSRQPFVAAALVFAVAVAGFGACSSDRESDTSIAVRATEFEFRPDSWTVPAGETATIDFDNIGALEHEWVVIEQGEEIESEEEFTEDKILFEVEAVPAGDSTTESFTIDEPGTYQVICAVETHFDAGMEGTLTAE